MTNDIRETKRKWYIKNRERILKKSREAYRKKVGLEPMSLKPAKIILTFD